MTTLALLSPPLRRLFRLIDLAPRPKSADLARLLEYWLQKRGREVLPRPADIDTDEIGAASSGWSSIGQMARETTGYGRDAAP